MSLVRLEGGLADTGLSLAAQERRYPTSISATTAAGVVRAGIRCEVFSR